MEQLFASLPVRVFEILFILAFFAISTYCAQLSWRLPYKQMMAMKEWKLRAGWYYGVFIQVMVVAAMLLSFVMWMALRLGG
ncbi:MAG: hypothetical protein GXO75_16180 [Calditrichaeota bacterium]|nr:hypothetical protein [Calditrichota bacterium]